MAISSDYGMTKLAALLSKSFTRSLDHPVQDGCTCRRCLADKVDPRTGLPVLLSQMVVCLTCGNKRCPHATSHTRPCTGSNAPGQLGSDY